MAEKILLLRAEDVHFELKNSRTFIERLKQAIRYANAIDNPTYRHLATDKTNYLMHDAKLKVKAVKQNLSQKPKTGFVQEQIRKINEQSKDHKF